jgi:hypothetical protein
MDPDGIEGRKPRILHVTCSLFLQIADVQMREIIPLHRSRFNVSAPAHHSRHDVGVKNVSLITSFWSPSSSTNITVMRLRIRNMWTGIILRWTNATRFIGASSSHMTGFPCGP